MSCRFDIRSKPGCHRDAGVTRRIDPWDATWDGYVGARSATAAAQPWWWLIFWFLLSTALLLLSAAPVRSQSAPPQPPDERPHSDRIKVVLKSDTRELAHDYLELLDQIRVLTEDYSRYYADFRQERAEQLEKQLENFHRQLNDSAYFGNLRQLSYDLARLHLELQRQEQELAALNGKEAAGEKSERRSDELEDRKLRKVTTSLRRELDMLKNRLEEDIGVRLADNAARSAIIQQYVKAAVIAAKVQEVAGKHHVLIGLGDVGLDQPLVVEVDLKMLQGMADALEAVDLHDIAVISSPEVPTPLPRLPDLTIVTPPDQPPDLPQPPAELGEKRIVYHRKSGEAGLTLEIVDSARAGSAVTPVYIVNPFGSLEVEGWDGDWIVVTAEIEIAAMLPEKAEALAERIGIRMHNKTSAVYVETVLPQLTDPQTRVVRADVRIKAPVDNPLNCRNSHGNLYVAGFDNDVKLSANHCDIDLRGVTGSVEVVNSMGRLQVSDVSGRLELRNAYEQLKVARCTGDMTIENAFAPIELTDCSGDVKIRNSGAVNVIDHTGAVDIQNNNGIVKVQNLDGNLLATNSLHPVLIENVRGSAGLKNVRGAIQITEIYGPLSASNIYGNITANTLSGPLQLVNNNGVIDLDIASAMAGRSSITADFGAVRLKMAEESDLLLTVEMFGGDIQSAFPMPVNKTDSSSSTRIELGRMLGSLDVSGRGSDVVISQVR